MRVGYQAFPIGRETIQAILTDESTEFKEIIHANAAGTITFTFDDTSTLAVTVDVGADFAIEKNVVSITTTAEVLLS